jgi:hypothetical protein
MTQKSKGTEAKAVTLDVAQMAAVTWALSGMPWASVQR